VLQEMKAPHVVHRKTLVRDEHFLASREIVYGVFMDSLHMYKVLIGPAMPYKL
jgi:hypothetical protein